MNSIEKQIANSASVSSDPKKHLLYYRHALADGERMEIPARLIEDKGCLISDGEPIPEIAIKKLFASYPDEQEKMDILYCPLNINPPVLDGVKSEKSSIYPYWIPAVLDRKGKYYPPSDETFIPWLVRGVLAPNDYLAQEYPVLSTVEKVDQEGCSVVIDRSSWTTWLTGSLDYFRRLVGFLITDYNLEDWVVDTCKIALIPAEIGGLTKSLLQFYDFYLQASQDRLPGTLASILSPRMTRPEAIDDPIRPVLQNRHLGQMANRFPLSTSQRISLALLNKTALCNAFAVNGPPGTGKTTLIQSIVADKIVKSFLAEEKPPIIVGCSANNKAITNILDSFASVTPSQELRTGLNERWLPEIEVLGHYLAANNSDKLERAREAGYWVTNSGNKGADAYLDYCAQHPKDECATYLLTKFRVYCQTNNVLDLKESYTYIKKKVLDLSSKVEAVMAGVNEILKFAAQYSLESVPVHSLGISVQAHIKMMNEERLCLETVLSQEHLRQRHPGFFVRLIDRIRFGNPAIRRMRIQSALVNRHDLASLLVEQDLNRLGENLWKQREVEYQKEITITRSWHELIPQYSLLEPYLANLDPSVPVSSREWVDNIQGELDMCERHEAFWWALHGVECQWLLKRDDDEYRALNQGESQTITRWKQRAYLTPVFVSTFHSLPNFFSYKKKTPQETWMSLPLSEIVNLLVIDEAGQVAPELGVPVFGLAEKAVVVGDVQQLEPIWNIPAEPVDYANGRRSGIVSSPESYQGFAESGRSSVNGSLMKLAQDSSAFIYPSAWSEAGSLLVEHRRCAPSIIEYCNRFVYQSLLDVKTKPKQMDFPALGYCHIGGESRKHHGSQANPVEANAIAVWIRLNKDRLLAPYKTTLANVCAIVTPFRGQQQEIIAALKKEGVYESGLVVGTVHALQGAEKPIVIFSPVYGRNHVSGSLFFNKSYNMLNVAISRAKDHFFVFGNMALFKVTETHAPASDLGRLLFETPESMIPNDFLFTEPAVDYFDSEPIDRISDLQKHRLSLKKAIETAQSRLVIVSPFISIQALDADGIPEILKTAVQRGIEILVITDANLDQVNGKLKPHAEKGRQALIEAGVNIKILSGIHNKTIIIDRRVLIEGSFNWLSAVRDETSPYYRMEASIVLKEPYCVRFINRVETELGIGVAI